jgi:hypothetical protein
MSTSEPEAHLLIDFCRGFIFAENISPQAEIEGAEKAGWGLAVSSRLA